MYIVARDNERSLCEQKTRIEHMDKEQSEGVRKIQSSFDGGDVVLRGKVPSRKV